MTEHVLTPGSHIARVIAKDPAALWTHVPSASSRRLLLAALDAFYALGFEGATTREIAARAQMSPGALYVHYEAKLDLLQQLLEVGHGAAWETVAESLEGVEGPPARLRVFAESFSAWHACNHVLGRVAQYELPALPPERMERVAAIRERFEALVRDELHEGVRDEGFDVTDFRGTTRAILSLGIDLVRWYSPDRGLGVEQIARLHGELVLRMVQPLDGA